MAPIWTATSRSTQKMLWNFQFKRRQDFRKTCTLKALFSKPGRFRHLLPLPLFVLRQLRLRNSWELYTKFHQCVKDRPILSEAPILWFFLFYFVCESLLHIFHPSGWEVDTNSRKIFSWNMYIPYLLYHWPYTVFWFVHCESICLYRIVIPFILMEPQIFFTDNNFIAHNQQATINKELCTV